MRTTADLVIVGAGPAGCATAMTAADAGLDTVLVDKAQFPRDKTCGDGLTALALHDLEALGIDAPAIAGYLPVVETVITGPTGHSMRLPHPSDGHHAAVVRRVDLDAALVRATRARGVHVMEGDSVTNVGVGTRFVSAALADGSRLEAPFLVAADGHWSTVRRSVDRGRRDLGEWHAARQYFEAVHDDRIHVIFDRDLLPGYAWMFPLPDGGANVGFGVLRGSRTGRALAATWPRVLASPSITVALGAAAEPVGPMRAWPIPTRYDARRLSSGGGRVLFVGDAAGVVDPMTGEGIAQALETGMLAARAVAHATTPSSVAREYRHEVGRELGADLRFSAALQRVLGSPLGARAALAAVDRSDWTRRSFARWMWEDYPRALLLTPRRWRRRMLSPPGAFLGIDPSSPEVIASGIR